ncbi:MAG: glycosyltransferase family 39 protein [Planctomycetota bacterium]
MNGSVTPLASMDATVQAAKVEPRPFDPSAWRKTPVGWSQYVGVCLIVLLATIPFLNKAYHVDDILYLQGAYQILNGHDAYHGNVLWDAPDGQPAPLFDIDFNPPLWKYVLALTIHFLAPDRAEWKLHLLESSFVLFAGFGLLALARRFCSHPVWVVAMVLWSPFFLPGQNLMLECPLLAFATWSVEFQCRAWETSKNGWSWLAGFFAALAILTKYTGGMLLPLFALGSLLARRRGTLVALILPAVTLAAYLGHNLLLYRSSHMASHGVFFDVIYWPARLLITVRAIGSVCVLGPVLPLLLLRQGWRRGIPLIGVVIVAGILSAVDLWQMLELSAREGWTPFPFQQAFLLLFSMNGWILLGSITLWAFAGKRSGQWSFLPLVPKSFLLVWIALLFLFNVTSVPFQAIRHLLLFMVPLTLLLAAWLEEGGLGSRGRVCLLVLSTFLGFSLASADYEIAGCYRELARTAVRRWMGTGRNVWFTGNWGFVYYATQEGARPLVDHPEQFGLPPVRPDDLVSSNQA